VDTLYDLASLTKAVATTMVTMILVDEGRLELDAPLSKWLPEFTDPPRNRVRVRDLLAHSAGFPAWAPLYKAVAGRDELVAAASRTELMSEPGTRSLYSDIGFIVLGSILEQETGADLDVLAARYLFDPLRMSNTQFRPSRSMMGRIAPTGDSPWRRRFVHGEVHDENAYRMGGVAGHAGLFSTAPDLARLAEALLRRGQYGDRRLASGATIDLFTRRVSIPGSHRTLGWATPPDDEWSGRWWSSTTFGHTGNTGTMLWVDPEQDLYVILLTNRVLLGDGTERFGRMKRELCEAIHAAMPTTCLSTAAKES
jgi:CubicO group peptidase (beta-lactamase class C family)